MCQIAQHAIDQNIPNITQNDTANQVGHEEHGTEYVGALDFSGQSQSQQECDDVDENSCNDNKFGGIAKGIQEGLIGDSLHIVGDTYPFCVINSDKGAEGQVQGLQERPDKAHAERCQSGQNEHGEPFFDCIFH